MHIECRYVNTPVPAGADKTCPAPSLQVSVLQELGNKKADSVRVGLSVEGVCGSRLVPAELWAEPLEEVQLFT